MAASIMNAILSPLVSTFQAAASIPRNFSGDTAFIFHEYPDVPVYLQILYVLLIFYGPMYFKDRQPMNVKFLFILWNAALSLFSLLGTISCVELTMFLLEDRGFYETTCRFDKNIIFDGRYAFWMISFLLSKAPELIDTVFLIVQKKPVIFLHWYHHLTVGIFCWHAGASYIPSGLWFATMNYAVHSIMYFYYFMCACGLRKHIRPMAPFITAAQLSQMFVGTGIVCYTFYYAYISPLGCEVAKMTIRMGICMYGSYMVLFGALFARLYLRPSSSKAVSGRVNGKGKATDSIESKNKNA